MEVGVGVSDELELHVASPACGARRELAAGVSKGEGASPSGPPPRSGTLAPAPQEEAANDLPHHIGRAAGGDQLAFVVEQLHVRDRDAVAEPHHAPGGDEVLAAPGRR